MSRRALVFRTLRTAVLGTLILAALIFLPAGTLAYWQGWLFIVVFVVSTNALGVYMVVHDPALLARRMRAGPMAEQRPVQRIIAALSFGAIFAVVVFGGVDRRYGWSNVPAGVVLLGDLLVVLGLFITLLVLRANTFAGASIEIAADQRVISNGPYAIVRHPMYAGALVMAAGIPLALGSWPGLVLVAAVVPVLVWRIRDEESMLRTELSGYAAYTAQVRWRLLPGLW